MVAESFARLPLFAGLPVEGGVPLARPRQAPGRAYPRMTLPGERPEAPRPAASGRDLRLRAIAAELLSRA